MERSKNTMLSPNPFLEDVGDLYAINSISIERDSPRTPLGSSSNFNIQNNRNTHSKKRKVVDRVKSNDLKLDSPKKMIVPQTYKIPTPKKPRTNVGVVEDEFGDEVPNDSLLAMQVLQSTCQNILPPDPRRLGIPPTLLKTQLYAMVTDRTQMDKELDTLQRSNQIRLFKFPTLGPEDYAIVFTNDYIEYIQLAKERARVKLENIFDEKVFDIFIEKVLPNCYDITISKQRLETLFLPEKLTENNLTLLMKCGILLLRDVDAYWFAIPNVGAFVKSCLKGRQEVISLLKKTKWKEMLSEQLMKKKLRFSTLPITFHINDLLGQGAIESVDTTAGKLYRLVHK